MPCVLDYTVVPYFVSLWADFIEGVGWTLLQTASTHHSPAILSGGQSHQFVFSWNYEWCCHVVLIGHILAFSVAVSTQFYNLHLKTAQVTACSHLLVCCWTMLWQSTGLSFQGLVFIGIFFTNLSLGIKHKLEWMEIWLLVLKTAVAFTISWKAPLCGKVDEVICTCDERTRGALPTDFRLASLRLPHFCEH